MLHEQCRELYGYFWSPPCARRGHDGYDPAGVTSNISVRRSQNRARSQERGRQLSGSVGAVRVLYGLCAGTRPVLHNYCMGTVRTLSRYKLLALCGHGTTRLLHRSKHCELKAPTPRCETSDMARGRTTSTILESRLQPSAWCVSLAGQLRKSPAGFVADVRGPTFTKSDLISLARARIIPQKR